jgi:hypothetical protein
MDWDELVETTLVAHPGARPSRMFGAPCVKRETGKVAFCSWQGGVVLEFVDESARSEALALDGAELFDPGLGRRMKEWALVPSAHSAHWAGPAERSLAG